MKARVVFLRPGYLHTLPGFIRDIVGCGEESPHRPPAHQPWQQLHAVRRPHSETDEIQNLPPPKLLTWQVNVVQPLETRKSRCQEQSMTAPPTTFRFHFAARPSTACRVQSSLNNMPFYSPNAQEYVTRERVPNTNAKSALGRIALAIFWCISL